jgi:uroporphyrinogen-III synthase
VYRWELPEDTAPLRRAIEAMIAGEAQVAIFTNAMQVTHVLQVAAAEGRADALRQALQRMVVASVGPTASEALRAEALPVDLEPTHPKMGPLVKEAAQRSQGLLCQKRGGEG